MQLSRITKRTGVWQTVVTLTVLVSGVFICGCSDSTTEPPPDVEDTIAPETIIDLRSSTTQATSLILNWTAPGDDANQGRAAEYDLRFSTTPLNDQNWGNAPRVSGVNNPLAAGLTERVTVSGLVPLTRYYFVVATRDEAENWSAHSNFHDAMTVDVLDVIAPAQVVDLAVAAVTGSTATLTWTATGDDGNVGTAFGYDIRYHSETIDESNWPQAVLLEVSPRPDPAGSAESWVVPGLDPQTTYYFAMTVYDGEVGSSTRNRSPISNVATATTE